MIDLDRRIWKMKLKKWMINFIILLQCLYFMLLASDCDDLKLFIISKIAIMIAMLINHYILYKYSNLFKEV